MLHIQNIIRILKYSRADKVQGLIGLATAKHLFVRISLYLYQNLKAKACLRIHTYNCTCVTITYVPNSGEIFSGRV